MDVQRSEAVNARMFPAAVEGENSPKRNSRDEPRHRSRRHEEAERRLRNGVRLVTSALRRYGGKDRGSFDLQQWTRIGAMNRTKTPHPAFGHPLPIRWGEGRVRGRFIESFHDLRIAPGNHHPTPGRGTRPTVCSPGALTGRFMATIPAREARLRCPRATIYADRTVQQPFSFQAAKSDLRTRQGPGLRSGVRSRSTSR